MPRIALIGDHDPALVAHGAIPLALTLAAQNTGTELVWDWIGTDQITAASLQLNTYDGIWCVPGSPYRSTNGALAAVRFARESRRPFLGTCGGFQHALIEFARNVAGVPGADHAETNAAATDLVVAPLACSPVGKHDEITFMPGSQLYRIFSAQSSREGYHCNYGPNPAYRLRFEAAGLRFTGFDGNQQIRAMEFPAHPFFIGTLFQPERSALDERSHPLIEAFIRATGQRE